MRPVLVLLLASLLGAAGCRTRDETEDLRKLTNVYGSFYEPVDPYDTH